MYICTYIDNLKEYIINRNIVIILFLILYCNDKANLRYEAKLQFIYVCLT